MKLIARLCALVRREYVRWCVLPSAGEIGYRHKQPVDISIERTIAAHLYWTHRTAEFADQPESWHYRLAFSMMTRAQHALIGSNKPFDKLGETR